MELNDKKNESMTKKLFALLKYLAVLERFEARTAVLHFPLADWVPHAVNTRMWCVLFDRANQSMLQQ